MGGSLADFAPQNRQETTGKFEQQGKREHFSLITTIISNDCKGLPKLAPKLGSQVAPVWVTGAGWRVRFSHFLDSEVDATCASSKRA